MQVVEYRPPAAAALRYDSSSVFLNGPIQGAPDWQAHAIARFRSVPSDLLQLDVLNPRRLSLGPDFDYAEQVAWEKANRKRASRYGSVLLFWFAAQDHSLEYPAGRPYAKTTKKELDRAFGWKDYRPRLNIALGVDPSFEGLERYTLHCINEFGLEIRDSLEATCDNALELIQPT